MTVQKSTAALAFGSLFRIRKRVAVNLWAGDGYFFLLLENLVAEADDSNKYQTELQSIVNTHSHPSSPEGTRAKEVATLLVRRKRASVTIRCGAFLLYHKAVKMQGNSALFDVGYSPALVCSCWLFMLISWPLIPHYTLSSAQQEGYNGCHTLLFRICFDAHIAADASISLFQLPKK